VGTSEVDFQENLAQLIETSMTRLRLRQKCLSRFPKIQKRDKYANSKRVGCGKKFKWSDLPKIEDELILELFKVKTIDQAKQLIQAGNFTEARQSYESAIDTTFH
jgi:hypothetical protein